MQTYYQPQYETMPPEELRKLQDERLRAQVKHVYNNVPHYRQLMDQKGVRPEDIVEGGNLPVKVFSNENLGMNTLVHGHIGAQQSSRISGKLRGWTNYKNGDNVMVSFKRKHFFDKETTNAIRKEGR